jgi:hypothetical protein
MARVFYEMPSAGFDKDLVNARADLAKRAEVALRETARKIASRARQGAPDDPHTSVDLRSTITFQGKGLNWKVGIDDAVYPSRGGNTIHQSPWKYGVWYEYGFKTLNIPTTPYMRPAADAEEDAHVQRLEAIINDSLKGGG